MEDASRPNHSDWTECESENVLITEGWLGFERARLREQTPAPAPFHDGEIRRKFDDFTRRLEALARDRREAKTALQPANPVIARGGAQLPEVQAAEPGERRGHGRSRRRSPEKAPGESFSVARILESVRDAYRDSSLAGLLEKLS